MTNSLDITPSAIDRIRHDLVGLKMPRALEALDHVVRRLEQGEIAALDAIDILLSEELTLTGSGCGFWQSRPCPGFGGGRACRRV